MKQTSVRERRKFDETFKREAVQNWLTSGKSAAVVGEPNKPPLKPDATTTYNFIIDTDKPVTSSRVIFNRIILENGKLADPQKDVKIE